MTITTEEDLFFRPPDGWIDKSVVIVTAPAHPDLAFPPNLVIARAPLKPEQTVEQFAEQALFECGSSRPAPPGSASVKKERVKKKRAEEDLTVLLAASTLARPMKVMS